MALMGSTVSPQALLMMQEPVHERMRKMDAQRIDVEALSINPYWYTAERDLARQIIAIQNEKLAEYCAAQAVPARLSWALTIPIRGRARPWSTFSRPRA
jgi:hypothetical protein